jgi:trehalose 6-phosphate synthase
MKIGVLSRRAPIHQSSDSRVTVEHVGGLTRVLPALAEFAEITWTSLTTYSQIGLPSLHPFSKISEQDFQNDINIVLTEVDDDQLNQADWFCTHYVWPLLHGLPTPESNEVDLIGYLNSITSISRAMASKSVAFSNDGFLVNDFQLSQVPSALRELAADKSISFFLHAPWPKAIPIESLSINILKFLASGMLAADVIEFQTQRDLLAFEYFVHTHLGPEELSAKLKVNPVSVNVQALQKLTVDSRSPSNIADSDVSYVHIARTDPIKNTVATITAFTKYVAGLKESQSRKFLDLYIVPSRQQWPEYQQLLAEISECVTAGNSRLSYLNYLPIRLHIGNDYQRAIQALTRYDFLIACSLADGLNLVVKEGAILNTRDGVIVSTSEVGAMAELGRYCVVAQDASETGLIQAFEVAAKLDTIVRKEMSIALQLQIKDFDVSSWAESVTASLKTFAAV